MTVIVYQVLVSAPLWPLKKTLMMEQHGGIRRRIVYEIVCGL